MAPKLGYLLPTRERIMEGKPETGPMLTLAERAAGLGFDSIWVGDSLLARPRHEPLTLLAPSGKSVAGTRPRALEARLRRLPRLPRWVAQPHQVSRPR